MECSILMQSDSAPRPGRLSSCHLALSPPCTDPPVNYGLKRTNQFAGRLDIFKRVSGGAPAQVPMSSKSFCCGPLSPSDSSNVLIRVDQPCLGHPLDCVCVCEGSSCEVRVLRGHSREGVNNHRASFSLKTITGIDCFCVSLVTVQLACLTWIKTDECRVHTVT